MKVLTAAEMREVDRLTIEAGITGPILMENAGNRVVDVLERRFSPLNAHSILILCGKGNNGGDGYVIARQLKTRFRPKSLHVVQLDAKEESDALRAWIAAGGAVADEITPEMRFATLVVDAVLGTGLSGPARGRALEFIREINSGFPLARVVAVDIPSGMSSDSGHTDGEHARADYTVTFTAPKIAHAFAPNCDRMGEIQVAPIGSRADLMAGVTLHLNGPEYFAELFADREKDSNKGRYGHVLVAGGAEGKTGAAEMTGLAALRAGAGLVTVACSKPSLNTLELMTEPLPDTLGGLEAVAKRANVVALGPGLGRDERHVEMTRNAVLNHRSPMVVDADGINALEEFPWNAHGLVRVLTPHPGEMSRLAGIPTTQVQADRLRVAREYSEEHGCALVLKGHRTVIAFPDGRAWVNPTGSPGLATGGTGDILTGLIAGLLAQFPDRVESAVLAGVYLHGSCGELGAARFGEQALLATDLLAFLPEAVRAVRHSL
jgi:hydroxyethylthiazole kinase-like uncharacterized protein yjeF